MKTVKIISGAYGQHIGNRVVVRDVRSGPFEIDDAEAYRIVSLGIATFTKSPSSQTNEQTAETMPAEDIPDESFDINNAEADDCDRPAYTINTPVAELREIAKACGITFAVGTTKAQMVEALDEYFDDIQPSEDMPNFTVGEPV